MDRMQQALEALDGIASIKPLGRLLLVKPRNTQAKRRIEDAIKKEIYDKKLAFQVSYTTTDEMSMMAAPAKALYTIVHKETAASQAKKAQLPSSHGTKEGADCRSQSPLR